MNHLSLNNITKVIFLTALSFVFMGVLNPSVRTTLKAYISPPFRTILAVTHADFDGSGKLVQVLKVKTHEGLFLEIYGIRHESQMQLPVLLAQTKLSDSRDGFFTFSGQVTNIAIDDIDGDSKPEILVSSFDNDLTAHLNVYRYLPSTHVLESVSLADRR